GNILHRQRFNSPELLLTELFRKHELLFLHGLFVQQCLIVFVTGKKVICFVKSMWGILVILLLELAMEYHLTNTFHIYLYFILLFYYFIITHHYHRRLIILIAAVRLLFYAIAMPTV